MNQELKNRYAHSMAQLEQVKVVPVVKIEDPAKALPLGRALMEGGLPCAEITFRTAAAAEAISLLKKELPELMLGAGTVLTPEQLDAAEAAGASFIVSPGFNPRVVDYAIKRGIPIFPGINNPTGIEAALERALPAVKFFPAEASGGLKMLKAMAAPYGEIRFMPTGGINAQNIGSYLEFPRVIACGGSWMVAADLIASENWSRVSELAREALASAKGSP